MEALREVGLRIFLPGNGFEKKLLRSAEELAIQGARIFDLQIAMLALEAGATQVWTHDKGFVRVPGLEVVDPLRMKSSL